MSEDPDSGEYRVLTDGKTYWVQYVYAKDGVFRQGWFGPCAHQRIDLLKDWSRFNQAVHKPILDHVTGEMREDALVRTHRAKTVDSA